MLAEEKPEMHKVSIENKHHKEHAKHAEEAGHEAHTEHAKHGEHEAHKEHAEHAKHEAGKEASEPEKHIDEAGEEESLKISISNFFSKKSRKSEAEKEVERELDIWKIATVVLGAVLIFILLSNSGLFDSIKLPSVGAGSGSAVKEYAALIDNDASKGSDKASVVMVEFSDFQCPFCQRFWSDTLPQIQKDYIDKGLVKFVYRDLPLTSIHPNAQKAAEAAECVREQTDDKRFFEFHDIIFQNQNNLGVSALKQYARRIEGVDGAKFDECLDSGKFAQEVNDDSAAARANGGSGTPFFIINGQQVSGAQPYQVFKQVIDQAIAGQGNAPPASQSGNSPPASASAQELEPDYPNYKDFIDDDPSLGNKNAKVTVIEFSDFQCPFCKQFFSQSLPSLLKEYIDSGKVRFVYRDLPLTSIHADAMNAALAANCAREQGGDETFFKYHDLIFNNQQALSANDLKRYAGQLSLDMGKFSSCLDSQKYASEVQNDLSDAASIGATGTPTFLINGYKVVGAQPYQVFTELIDTLLAGNKPTAAAGSTGEQAAPSAAGCGIPSDTQQQQLADTSNDPAIQFTVITDSTCASCDTSGIMNVVQNQLFPTTKGNTKTLDYSKDKEAKSLVDSLGIIALPAYIFDSKISQAANFGQVSGSFDQKNGYYIITASAAGSSKYLSSPSVDDDPVMGSPDAPVTMIEFSDFQCPFCKQFFDQSLATLKEKYINTGKVKFVYRDFPLSTIHADAQIAAEAANCAREQGGDETFFKYHDLIFNNQASIANHAVFAQFAGQLALDTAKFQQCLDSGKYTEEVNNDFNDGRAFGVSGTPTFFINGQSIGGAQPVEAFEKVIDAELAK